MSLCHESRRARRKSLLGMLRLIADFQLYHHRIPMCRASVTATWYDPILDDNKAAGVLTRLENGRPDVVSGESDLSGANKVVVDVVSSIPAQTGHTSTQIQTVSVLQCNRMVIGYEWGSGF
jgi:hypothetical protein